VRNIGSHAFNASQAINKWVERLCVAVLVLLVLDVWLGMLARYVLPWRLTFTEELARYLMIWVALLAISVGLGRRQHIGIIVLFQLFPRPLQRILALTFDVIGLIFFGVLFYYGIGFVQQGFTQVTMIFGIPRGYPNLIIPISAGLACIQLFLLAIHDVFAHDPSPASERT
jgi:TRAP-type transport system small permease protein